MRLRSKDVGALAPALLSLEGTSDEASGLDLSGAGDGTPGRLVQGEFDKYRILGLLGTGGMGEVYEAEQQNPPRRVALKIIRPGLISDESRRRFEHEVRVLGSLQHPGIAQIYDAGQWKWNSGDGEAKSPWDALGHAREIPYFAMEFVDGRPLLAYAQERRLSLAQRLELFLKVCDAVSHAHQRGVIHRDLKPSNILVTAPGDGGEDASGVKGGGVMGGVGEPKVLDFGVARATDSDVAATTGHTNVGQMLGTLPYMSPEQVSGQMDKVDTRSDVYALGVVLYELVSGRLPHVAPSGTAAPEVIRMIAEAEPPRLGSLSRAWKGDIEAIVSKAMEKRPERRYQSVTELAGDIRRHLDNEPIVARSAGRWQQARKFARRHRSVVATLVILTISTVLLGWLLNRAETAERGEKAKSVLAERRAEHNAAVASFMQELMQAPEVRSKGPDVKVVDALEAAMTKLEKNIAMSQPDVAAAVATSIGLTYESLNKKGQAKQSLQKAVQWWKDAGDVDPVAVIKTDLYLIRSLLDANPLEESRSGIIAIQERADREMNEADPFRATIAIELAIVCRKMNRRAEAESAARWAYEHRVRTRGADDRATLDATKVYGSTLEERGVLAEADALYARTLRSLIGQFGENDPLAILTLASQARVRMRLDEFDVAVPMLRKAIELSPGKIAPANPAFLSIKLNLARCLYEVGDLQEAEQLASETHAAYEKNNAEAAGFQNSRELLAMIRGTQGDMEFAETTLKSVQEQRRITFKDPTHTNVIASLGSLARVYMQGQRYDDAMNMLKEAIGLAQGAKEPDVLLQARLYRSIGECEMKRQRVAEAVVQFQRAEKLLSERGAIHSRQVRLLWTTIAACHRLNDNEAAAAAYDARIRAAEPIVPDQDEK